MKEGPGTAPVVVKLGGSVPPDPVLDDVAALVRAGTRVVVVHGGGPHADRLAGRLGVPVRTLDSPDGTRGRRTDPAALEVLTLALLGQVKPALVAALRARGVPAAGLSGADAALVTAERKTALRSVENGRTRIVRDDLSGRISAVEPAALTALLAAGIVPVVSPPAADRSGRLLNVDSDRVAAALALSIGARALVLLTDTPGVLADPADPGTVLPELSGPPPSATGRMRHKIRAALVASARVPHVVIASGLADRPVGKALAGDGTVVTPGGKL